MVGGRFSPWTPEHRVDHYVRSLGYVMRDLTSKRVLPAGFEFDRILRTAIERGEINRNRLTSIPDEKWWRKLCAAAGEKPTSRYGSNLLRDRLVHFLTNRLVIEQTLEQRADEIAKETIPAPIFIIGNPRSSKHFILHTYARGGYTLPLRFRDTMFIAQPHEEHRREAAKQYLNGFRWLHPAMQTVRSFDAEAFDDDIALQLMRPQSIGWGLLHGMSDYLYECLQEDHQPTYDLVRKSLQVLSWYRTCNQYSDGVEREMTTIDNPVDKVVDGDKDELKLKDLPFIVHSPLAILHGKQLHQAFPDMRVIWVHRPLNGSVASMCGAVAQHDAMYTGRAPRETTRTEMGEMVLGLFGSGSEHTIDYMGTFPPDRMVHWSSKDFNRSGIRLMVKTHAKWWPDDMDNFRKRQAVSGMTELRQTFRPRNDAELGMFGIHEGMVNDAFRAYAFQFEEFSFESKFGMRIENYQPMGGGIDESAFGLMGRDETERVSSLEQMPADGHMLQQHTMFRPTEYIFTRPKPQLSSKTLLPPK